MNVRDAAAEKEYYIARWNCRTLVIDEIDETTFNKDIKMLQNEQIALEKEFSKEFILTWIKLLLSFSLKSLNIRGVFRTQPNISDGMFSRK